MKRRTACAALAAGSCALLFACLLRLTIRDQFRVPAAIFYGTPWPLLALGALLLAVAWWRFGKRSFAVAMAVIAGAAGLAWGKTSWRWQAASPQRGDLRVVFWNVSRPDRNFPAVAAWLRARNADLLMIAEAQPRKFSTLARWREAFPDYRVEPSQSGMLCLVRGEVASLEGVRAPGYYRASAQATVRGGAVRLVQVDFNANPLATRKIPLGHLAAFLDPLANAPVILAGDFNTPRDSVHFAPLRARFVDTFEAAGAGLGDTWPLPVPILSLDQIWVSRTLRVVRCEVFSSWLSDHRAVLADLAFARE